MSTKLQITDELVKEFIQQNIIHFTDEEFNGRWNKFKESKQLKPFMFTSEDGINIYDGDKICLLNTETWLVSWPVTAPQSPFKGDKEQFKYFSCREEAHEYKLQNQPLFNLKEIRSIGNVGENNPYYKKLVALAESKLNKNE